MATSQKNLRWKPANRKRVYQHVYQTKDAKILQLDMTSWNMMQQNWKDVNGCKSKLEIY